MRCRRKESEKVWEVRWNDFDVESCKRQFWLFQKEKLCKNIPILKSPEKSNSFESMNNNSNNKKKFIYKTVDDWKGTLKIPLWIGFQRKERNGRNDYSRLHNDMKIERSFFWVFLFFECVCSANRNKNIDKLYTNLFIENRFNHRFFTWFTNIIKNNTLISDMTKEQKNNLSVKSKWTIKKYRCKHPLSTVCGVGKISMWKTKRENILVSKSSFQSTTI